MLTLTDITFYANTEFDNAEQQINSQSASLGYLDYIKKDIQVEVIRHAHFKEQLLKEDVPYYFFKNTNHFFNVPFKALRHLYQRRPDIILVQGLSFPFQVIILRLLLGRDTIIL